jgi:HSP20 family protein
MLIVKWDDPFEMDGLFEEMPTLGDFGWDLAADVKEDGDHVYVDLQMPGVDSDSFELEVENGKLMVSGSRKKETEESDQNYHRREIHRGSFSRVVQLPLCDMKTDEMRASTEDGVLKVVIPKG